MVAPRSPRRSACSIALCCALGLLLCAASALAYPTGGPAPLSLQMRAPSAAKKPRVVLASSTTAHLAASAVSAAAVGAPDGGQDRELTALDAPSDSAPKFYERGWFWPVLGGIVAAVIITVVIAESVGGSDRMPTGSLGTIEITVPK